MGRNQGALMVMLATLRRSGGVEAVARRLAVPTVLAMEVVTVALPMVLGAYSRRYEDGARDGCGVTALGQLLLPRGGGGLAHDVMIASDFCPEPGWALAEVLLGSRGRVEVVAAHCAGESGLEAEVIGRAMPILFMLVGGYLAARAEVAAGDLLGGDPANDTGVEVGGAGGAIAAGRSGHAPHVRAEFARLLGPGGGRNPLEAIPH